MAAWIKVPSTATWKAIMSKASNFDNTPILYSVDISDTDKLRFYIRHNQGANDAAPSVTSNRTVADNRWHHIAVSYNPTTGYSAIYIDGLYDNSGTLTTGNIVSSDRTLQLGNIYYTSRIFYLTGALDDVRVYNRALSQIEVTQLYKMGGGKINKTNLTAPALKNGLLGHWTFDGPDVTANTTTDKSGSGNDGTRNGTTKIRGKIGQGMTFNGTSDFIDVSDTPFDITSNLTLSTWIKIASTSQTQILIWKTNAYGLIYNYNGITGCNLSQFCFAATNGTAWSAISNGSSVNLNTWYHVVGVFDDAANTLDLYVNGLKTSPVSLNGSIANTSLNLHLGNYDSSPDAGYLAGSLDDARVYNRALSPAEIMQLYRMGK